MRVVVIGASGHIGTFLVPRLVRAGHEVVAISRGRSTPYADAPEWSSVERVVADREAEDAVGTFPDRIAALRPDALVDLVCFTVRSAAALVDRLRGEDAHLVFCGSIWRAGASRILPITEGTADTAATPPFGEYGTQKDAIARLLADETAAGGLITTSLHPGHISGPGWVPIGPTGNLSLDVWTTLASGEPLPVPGLGAESMAHVHADDVAQAFELAVARREAAAGQDFFVTAADALTVRGYAELGASWYGRGAQLEPVSWDAFRAGLESADADASWEHLSRSQAFSVDKARRLLGYEPGFTAAETVHSAVAALAAAGRIPAFP